MSYRPTETEDRRWMRRAIELALETESAGNPPIGAVITLEGMEVAAGACCILHPTFNPGRHAEMEAISKVPVDLWPRARGLTCYSTLEPCPMCLGSLLLHDIGRVVFGAGDPLGGGGMLISHLPHYFDRADGKPEWIGPIEAQTCDPLFKRAVDILELRHLLR